MDENTIVFGVMAWLFKEAYQSFVGSRAKTLEKLDKVNDDVSVLRVELRAASERIKLLQISIDILSSEERKYRV